MNKTILIVAIVAVVVLVAGGVYWMNSKGKTGLISSNDIDSLISAADSCTSAKTIQTSSVLPGIGLSTTILLEIKKFDDGKCGFYSIIKTNTIKYPDELVQSLLTEGEDGVPLTMDQIKVKEATANQQAQSLVGKESLCKFGSNEALKKYLIDFKEGSYSFSCSFDLTTNVNKCAAQDPDTGKEWDYECTGSAFEQPTA